MNRALFYAIMVCVVSFVAMVTMGCASTPEPRIITREVKVPVAVPCVGPSVPGPPAYPDTDDALRDASGPAARYALLGAGREKRQARLSLLESVIEICRAPPK